MPDRAGARVYVDTCVYIDLLTKNGDVHPDSQEPRWRVAKALFDAVNDDRVTLASSALIEAELRCFGAVRDGSQEVHDQVAGWFRAESTLWTDVDSFLARDAARLAREWYPRRADKTKKMGGPDAVHLAGAVRLRCDYLMTHDGGFPIGHEVEGVKVIRPAIVWPTHLFDEAS
jgi:predicted nucleic acid-binding protein